MKFTRATLCATLLLLASCSVSLPGGGREPRTFTEQVQQILREEEPSAEQVRAHGRLESMGPELDPVLVALAGDERANPTARANALILLADRRAPAALPTLQRLLREAGDERVRSGAVLGLQRLKGESEEAARAIRGAIDDPSRRVRLNVLQALDVEEVEVIRSLLDSEEDREVRKIAEQLVALAESRGAPLAAERNGEVATIEIQGEPRLVFRAARRDTAAGVAVGALFAELPSGIVLPIAERVEVVAGVVPAFFSPDRSAVVYEAEGEIQLRDLRAGTTRTVGSGVAPRPIPFADGFVFLREQGGRRQSTRAGMELRYEVLRASFSGGEPERLGVLRAVAQRNRFGNQSPVRWMVIGEGPVGFVLRGERVTTFALPAPFEGPVGRSRVRSRPERSPTPTP